MHHTRSKNPWTDQEHREILAALQERNPAKAQEAVQSIWCGWKGCLEARIPRHGGADGLKPVRAFSPIFFKRKLLRKWNHAYGFHSGESRMTTLFWTVNISHSGAFRRGGCAR